MRKFLFATVAAAALAFGVPAGQAKASWLSDAIHGYLNPAPYGTYTYYGPAYAYLPPAYSYTPFYGYYTVPYVVPYRAYWSSRGYYVPRGPGPVWHAAGPRIAHPGWWWHRR